MKASYQLGGGKASQVVKSDSRRALLVKHFGCPLIGTFNMETERNNHTEEPTIVDDIHKFYLVRIQNSKEYRYGWAYRWEGSTLSKNQMEVYTKSLLPDHFKTEDLEITFCHRWDKEIVAGWQKGLYWFQGYDWLEKQRSDSYSVWEHMKGEDYTNKTVLDLGCHTGYFSMQASKKGAIVHGVDLNKNALQQARDINEHIEMQDVLFTNKDVLRITDQTYDYIIELSVFHWISSKYDGLKKHINLLRDRCRVLYIELINPPLEGSLKKEDVDKIVGSRPLIYYKHRIRKHRALYKVEGNVK